jgi:hypothetical protein
MAILMPYRGRGVDRTLVEANTNTHNKSHIMELNISYKQTLRRCNFISQ